PEMNCTAGTALVAQPPTASMVPAATSPTTSMRSRSSRNCGTLAATVTTLPPRPVSDAHGLVLGGGGAGAAVVKLNVVENALVPDAFRAFTRQKYCVPAARPLTTAEVAVIPAWSKIVLLNAALVETWTR